MNEVEKLKNEALKHPERFLGRFLMTKDGKVGIIVGVSKNGFIVDFPDTRMDN